MLRESLLEKPEQIGSTKASAHLLQLAYAGETFLDWSSFANLPTDTMRAVFESDGMKQATGISLTVQPHYSPQELIKTLASLESLQTCEILDQPDRENDDTSKAIYEAFVNSSQPLALKKINLSGLYTYGLRQKIWRPYREHPKLPAAFPVSQLVVAHTGVDAGEMEQHGEDLEFFYLGDAALSPVRIVNSLFQFLATMVRLLPARHGSGLNVASVFACGSSELGGGEPTEIAPIPAEIHTIAKVRYHTNIFQGLQSKMRDLIPGTWTILVSRLGDTDWGDRDAAPDRLTVTELQFKYAFVKAREAIQVDPKNWRGNDIQPSEIDVVGMDGFLRQTAPEVDTNQLAHHFNELERLLVKASDQRYSFTARGDGPLLSVMTPEEACTLLSECIAAGPRMEEKAQQACRWGHRGGCNSRTLLFLCSELTNAVEEGDHVAGLGFEGGQQSRGPVPVVEPHPEW